jgi:hypothetical protein
LGDKSMQKSYVLRCLERPHLPFGLNNERIATLAEAIEKVDPEGKRAFDIALRLRADIRSGKIKKILF